MLIYHVVLPKVWEEFKDKVEYEAQSLKVEGFIHCSYKYQLEKVLERYFSEAEKVIILSINPHRLNAKVVIEPSTDGEFYPHVYGKINLSAVTKIEERHLRC
ncbi:MAG: DUF952 domain-containing protein [Acidobacteria bacterium]|jgi:uncharacterized protein (DUF952 family)|nr:MAG: DUF952 domain-containing protein [Acidobacteriota bacterium]GIU82881.1 MAG: hypothetical protein KatS3mg006_1945 [Pyrinomonadaceae bacterium]